MAEPETGARKAEPLLKRGENLRLKRDASRRKKGTRGIQMYRVFLQRKNVTLI